MSRRSRIGASTSVIIAAILCFFALQSHAQTPVNLSPEVHPQFLDSNGAVLAGGFLYTYAAGTTTRQDTYTDSTGTIINAWPIPLDATGSPSNGSTQTGIWLSNTTYKFCVYNSALVQQWCVDNIPSGPAGGAILASSLTSASANPSSTGVIRLATGDLACWRNAANSANVCLSLDAANNLTWSAGTLVLPEVTCPSGIASRVLLCADTSTNRLNMSNNADPLDLVVGQNTTDTLANKTLTSTIITNPTTTGTDAGSETLVNKTLSSPAITSPVISSPAINGGINNSGTGLQHIRFTSCSNACSGSSNWNDSWADTNYTMVCNIFVSNSSQQSAFNLINKSTTGFTYVVQVLSGVPGPQEVDCIGIHD